MSASASTLVCAGCGWAAPPAETNKYPFRCPNAGRDDTDHVIARTLDSSRVEWQRGDDPNPFVRHRELFHAWRIARRRGHSDETYVDLVRRLDTAIAAVDGRGFRTTPFGVQAALGAQLGVELWVKDETGNVGGSHKARHLMGILLYLNVVERAERPPLAIASCGNAALAAAILARAVDRRLRVFVPTTAEPAVLEQLRALGAEITACARVAGATGDPCVQEFHAALAAGALPFCCQGNENGLTIEGGETLACEIASALGSTDVDHVVIQVGGGALASAVIHGMSNARRAGVLRRLPQFHTVQTRGASPLKRAWDRFQEQSRLLGERAALERATKHRSEFMRPWDETPHSIATGILDDETYDWLAVIKGMVASGGTSVVVDEDTLREANALARSTTRINVDHTGSAGLAGVIQLKREGVVAPGEKVAVIFSGVARSPSA